MLTKGLRTKAFTVLRLKMGLYTDIDSFFFLFSLICVDAERFFKPRFDSR